ncbi:MAG: tRNA glutamyl-Q(34) synthetase GluQRS [Sphingosinicella sp.]|nr:tRNA glutamyl-Q(34) synthetase GluQRS [Sphingosinicella sp.]
MKDVVTRFAPSPTGRLHLGHAYSALLAHRFARDRNGIFLLRIEDIDPGRARPEYVDFILEDLEWLGLSFDDAIVYQSERLPLYSAALGRLKERALVYPCFCTRSEIAAEVAASAAAPQGPDGPIYPGTCKHMSDDERVLRLQTEAHAWRLDTAKGVALAGPIHWQNDEGEVRAEPGQFGDVIVARKDAPVSYHLAVTIDDAAQGVTDIVRGMDLYASTHVHRLLQALLDLPIPHYHHHPLLSGADGQRLAKRHGAPSLASLRDAGADPGELATDLLGGRLPAGYSATGP